MAKYTRGQVRELLKWHQYLGEIRLKFQKDPKYGYKIVEDEPRDRAVVSNNDLGSGSGLNVWIAMKCDIDRAVNSLNRKQRIAVIKAHLNHEYNPYEFPDDLREHRKEGLDKMVSFLNRVRREDVAT